MKPILSFLCKIYTKEITDANCKKEIEIARSTILYLFLFIGIDLALIYAGRVQDAHILKTINVAIIVIIFCGVVGLLLALFVLLGKINKLYFEDNCPKLSGCLESIRDALSVGNFPHVFEILKGFLFRYKDYKTFLDDYKEFVSQVKNATLENIFSNGEGVVKRIFQCVIANREYYKSEKASVIRYLARHSRVLNNSKCSRIFTLPMKNASTCDLSSEEKKISLLMFLLIFLQELKHISKK